MRRSQLPHQQAQAKLDFKRCCQTLEILKHAWWSADIIATLAHKVLGEIEKASDPPALRRNSQHPMSDGARGHSYPSQVQPTRDAANTNTQPGPSGAAASSLLDLSPAGGGIPTNETTNFDPTELELQPTFEDIDKIFGAYLDPHFPVNYDDLLSIDNIEEFGWNGNSWS
jgi:hypothetical protein